MNPRPIFIQSKFSPNYTQEGNRVKFFNTCPSPWVPDKGLLRDVVYLG
jgi:hypothetical protein